MMNSKIIFLLFFCSAFKVLQDDETNHFPTVVEKPDTLPRKENFYIFILAGQSNMAGRGFVQPQDTLPSKQVLALDKKNEWVYAKEPIHYYEPDKIGLDCGLSFGKNLAALYGQNITIGLVPCAIGGSSIEQWLGDSTYRKVKLYSNFLKRIKAVSEYGIIKGLLWHQGESNSNTNSYKNYKEKLESFFIKIRSDLNNPELPVYAGEIPSFLNRQKNPFTDSVN